MIRISILPTLFFLCSPLLRAQVSSNYNEHDRYISALTQYNTRYINNADSHPKIDIDALAARILAGFGSRRSSNSYSAEQLEANRSNYGGTAARTGPVNTGPTEGQLAYARFEVLEKELAAHDYTHLKELGDCYYFGRGVTADRDFAAKIYRASSDTSPAAAFLAARMIYDGDGPTKDEDIGVELMREAARLKSGEAVAWLASHGQRPVQDLAQFKADDPMLNPIEGKLFAGNATAADVSAVRARADAGNPRARFLIGEAYERGIVVEKDPKQAVAMYKMGAEDKNPLALWRLGKILWNGELGQSTSQMQGTHYMLEAKELGNVQAIYSFGQAFSSGSYLLKLDKKAAADFYRAAAERRYPPAELALAKVLYAGDGVAADDERAALWARQAMEDKQPGAATLLAKMMATGAGVPVDHEQSLALMRRAAAAGDSDATEAIAKGFNGTLASTPRSSPVLAAYNSLPPLIDRQIEYFRKQHDALPKLSAEDFAKKQQKYAKTSGSCQKDPQIALQLGRHLLSPEADDETLQQSFNYLMCATMQNTPGALDDVIWNVFLRYYHVRNGNSYEQSSHRALLEQGIGQWKENNALMAYLAAGYASFKNNPTLVRAYMGIAISLGQPQAEVDYAAMNWEGIGGERDDAEGTRLMQAAAQSDPYAMYLLGVAYAYGVHGLTADPKRALELETLASSQGVIAARAKKEELQTRVRN